MNIVVMTPDKKVFEGEVTSVKVPGVNGGFEVLNNHAPLVSALGKGEVTLAAIGGNTVKFTILSGFIEVLNNGISLLVQGVVENK